MNKVKIILLLTMPLIIVGQYFLFKVGIISPITKGIEFKIVEGDYVQELDKFVMKLDDTITFSSGNYTKIPSYSKDPDISLKVLGESDVVSIDQNEITSLKEGYATIGLMKGSVVLKKVDVLVVSPNVEKLIPTLDSNLYYVGDTANIETEVLVDYDKFKTKETVKYESSDDTVLKVQGDKVLAVGVGNATLSAISGDRTEIIDEFDILVQISQIKIDNKINLTIDDKYKLEPEIITSPKNLEYQSIKYQFADKKLDVQRSVALDNKGNLVAIREGSERINIVCQNKVKTITVNVSPKPIENDMIQNLQASYEIFDNKLQIELIWDYLKSVSNYEVYIRDNTLNSEFQLYDSIKLSEEDMKDKNKVSYTLIKDIVDGQRVDLDIYVIGKTDKGYTKPSETININLLEEDITNQQIQDLIYIMNENIATLNWTALNIPNVTYSIYMRDKSLEDEGFILYDDNLTSSSYDIKIEADSVDYDIYVVANKDGKVSKQSNIINVVK